MTVCALINVEAGIVENMIVAEASDHVDEGYLMIADPPEGVNIGTAWDGTQFVIVTPVKPNPVEGLDTL